MNTQLRSERIIGSGSLLALVFSFSASAYAGPYWQRMEKAEADFKGLTKNSVEASNRAVPTTMPCEACQTTILRASRWIGPPGKGRLETFAVGARHTCAHCGGEIKIVRGRTTNSMQHNCPMCKDAARCFVAVHTPAAKP